MLVSDMSYTNSDTGEMLFCLLAADRNEKMKKRGVMEGQWGGGLVVTSIVGLTLVHI